MSLSLLPPNATALERAAEAAIGARYGDDARLITATWNPDTCPAWVLPFLAWALSIDLWDESWPELKKRQVCRNAFALHRLKGSLAGIRAHLALVDAELVKIVRPPSRTFCRSAMTAEQREDWLASLPQLRVYPYLQLPLAQHRPFLRNIRRVPQLATIDAADWSFDSEEAIFDEANRWEMVAGSSAGVTFAGTAFLRASRAIAATAPRATLWDLGEEREIGTARVEEGEVTRFLIGRTARRSWMGRSAFAGATFAQHSRALGRVVTLRLSDDAAGFAVQSGMDPIDVRPVRVAERRTPPAPRAFIGRHARGLFLCRSAAPRFIYDRVSLHAPDRLGARRHTRSFMGSTRLGMPAFSAELRVRVQMHRPRTRAARWMGAGYLRRASMAPLDRAIEAVRVSKSARDRITIDTATTAPVQFGSGLRFGDFTFGEIRKVA